MIEFNPDISIQNLSMMGTHDSGTDSIGKYKPGSGIARTQSLSIYDQLMAGCRYLDIRVAGNGSKPEDVYIYHGFIQSQKYSKVIDQIDQFLRTYKSEIVIVEIVKEYGRKMSYDQAMHVAQYYFDKLGDIAVPESKLNVWYFQNETPLKNYIENKKRVMMMLTNQSFTDIKKDDENEYISFDYLYSRHFLDGRYLMQGKFHDTNKIPELLNCNLEQVDAFEQGEKKLFTHSFTLTPKAPSNCTEVLSLICGCFYLRIDNSCSQLYLYSNLPEYFKKHIEKPWKIVCVDFVDSIPSLMTLMISRNFRKKLTIYGAAVTQKGQTPKDVKALMEQNLSNENSLIYLPDIQIYLKIPDIAGKITIIYQFEGGAKHIKTLKFTKHSCLILSYYTHIEEDIIQIDETQKQGYLIGSNQINTNAAGNDKSKRLLQEDDDPVFEYFIQKDNELKVEFRTNHPVLD